MWHPFSFLPFSKSIFQLPGLGANRRSVDLVCLHARIITNDALATAAIGVSSIEIRSSDFIINLDTLHFFGPIFIFRTENAQGRRGPSPTNDRGFLRHKTTKKFFH